MKKVKQAAEQLNVAPSTIYTMCQQGLLPHVRIGVGRGTIRIAEQDLAQFLEGAKASVPTTPPVRPKSGGGPFKHLDGERLRHAWRQQGVGDRPPNERNARS